MPTLLNIRPMLQVSDMNATIAFWTDRLGFETTASMAPDNDPTPFWCNLTRDGFSIMFTYEPEHTHDDGEIHKSEAQLAGALYFNVDDVDAFAAELKQRGAVTPDTKAEDQPHGMREVVVEDPNGFVVIFGQPL